MEAEKPKKIDHWDFLKALKAQSDEDTLRDLLQQDEFVSTKVIAQMLKVGIIDIPRAVRMLVVTMCRRGYALTISDGGIAEMLGTDKVAAVKGAVGGMAVDGLAWREGKTGQRRRRWRIGKRTAESYVRKDAGKPNLKRSKKHAVKRPAVSSAVDIEETDGLSMKSPTVSSPCRNEETDSLSPLHRSECIKRMEGDSSGGEVTGTTTTADSVEIKTSGEADRSQSSPIPSDPPQPDALDEAAEAISPDEAGRLFVEEVLLAVPDAVFVGPALFAKGAAVLADALMACPSPYRRDVVELCAANLAGRNTPLKEWNPAFVAERVPQMTATALLAAEQEARRAAEERALIAAEEEALLAAAEERRRAEEQAAAERAAEIARIAEALAADKSTAEDYPSPCPLTVRLDKHFGVPAALGAVNKDGILYAMCKYGVPVVRMYVTSTFPDSASLKILEGETREMRRCTSKGYSEVGLSLGDALDSTRRHSPDEAEKWFKFYGVAYAPETVWMVGKRAPKGLVAAFHRDMAGRLRPRAVVPGDSPSAAPSGLTPDAVFESDSPTGDAGSDGHGDDDVDSDESLVDDFSDGDQEDEDPLGVRG